MDGPVFIAYPAEPSQLAEPIKEAATRANERAPQGLRYSTWEDLGIPGQFIDREVLTAISSAGAVVADITRLNFNVTFEIGYAIGCRKPVRLVVNRALSPEVKAYSELGLFDMIGHEQYDNAQELRDILGAIESTEPLRTVPRDIDRSAPIFVLDTLHKTDASLRITSRIKKARIKFRSFDPNEQPRLSALNAYQHVSASVAVVVHLLSENASDWRFNNLRGAFLAGLAYGLDREALIFQEANGPVPLDYREFVESYKHPTDIDEHINALAPM